MFLLFFKVDFCDKKALKLLQPNNTIFIFLSFYNPNTYKT